MCGLPEHGALWQWLIDAIDAHEPVALLIVTDSMGSSPGKIGSKMAATARRCIGTIGGGAVEIELVKTARSLLISDETGPNIYRLAHHPSTRVQPSGMICGGEQTVLVYPCRPEDKALFQQLLQSCQLRTPLGLFISALGLRVMTPIESGGSPEFINGEDWYYRETVGQYPRAYIIGGGHVGLALSRLLDMLNFDITLIDDREQVDSMRANPHVRQKWRIAYAEIAEHIPEGPDVFVFIMTHSHHTDALVTVKLAKKRFAYLGLLGSSHKIAWIKASLRDQLSGEQLQRIHAPMGLPIQSHTPEEIAISIAAEIIQLVNASQP